MSTIATATFNNVSIAEKNRLNHDGIKWYAIDENTIMVTGTVGEIERAMAVLCQ